MLTYSFEKIGHTPLYEHLYKCIREDILSGKLTADEKLPSKRNIAAHLGISVITVENAYSQLVAEGYIYSVPKKGYYVSKIDIPWSDNTRDHNTADTAAISGQKSQDVSINAASDSFYTSMIHDDTDHKEKPDIIADFTSNQTDQKYFPFSIWSKLIREVLSGSRYDLMKNSPPAGIPILRQAISDQLKSLHGINVSSDRIIVGAGTEYLYSLIIQLLGHDKIYGVEDPGYKKISSIYKSNNVQGEYIRLDEYGVIPEELEKNKIDVIHISPSHQFPTGITMPIGRRLRLLSWAAASPERYIIEDDYDSEFRLTGQPIPPLQTIDTMEKVIYINTFSKTLSSTVRISYMVLPEHLVSEYYKKLGFYSCTVSTFEQYTLAAFLRRGYFEKHINRLRMKYRAKNDALVRAFKEKINHTDLQIIGADAGLHFLIHLSINVNDRTFCHMAAERGIIIKALSDYYAHEEKNMGIFVMNYSSIEDSLIENIAETMSGLLSDI